MSTIEKHVKDAEKHLQEDTPAAKPAAPAANATLAGKVATSSNAEEFCGAGCQVKVGVFTAILGIAAVALSRAGNK